MFLADTSIWIDHLNGGDAPLEDALNKREVICHPYIVAEIALGSLKNRNGILRSLDELPSAKVATIEEVRALIENHKIFSRGIGLIDCHLIASALLTNGAKIWTRDKRLHAVASELNIVAHHMN